MKGAIFTMGSRLAEGCWQAGCSNDGLHACPYCEDVYCDDHFEDGMCWHCAGGDEGNYEGPR